MKLAFDTYYYDNKAKTVCLCFEQWPDETPLAIKQEVLTDIAPYESGAFYKRELPCVLSLLKQIPIDEIEIIIIDGYVILDNEGKLGLGGYLYEALDQKIPIIGVAKSKFVKNTQFCKALLRGDSKNPLYISSMGISLEDAYASIKMMHGPYRMPSLLQIVDQHSKADKDVI